MTRGQKSSEYKALRFCFYANIILAVYGVYKGVDLMGMAALMPAMNSPMMIYAGARSYVKGKNGESD